MPELDELDELDQRIINQLQGGFPLVERPFAVAAARLHTDEATLLQRLSRLLAEKVLTRFGPMFQVERMGGAFVLAAMAVPEERFQAVAAQVNEFPEVAHNYRREHALNMWFVLATEHREGIPDVVARVEAKTGLPVYPFPKEREYFVEMKLAVGGQALATDLPSAPHAPSPGGRLEIAEHDLREVDRALVLATQGGLPLVPQPYLQLGRAVELPAEAVMVHLQSMLARGVIRRIGVVPNHYAIGWTANGMTVWDVADDRVDELGAEIGQLPFVTHCYRRPRALPHWPYNLFAMVHGSSREAVEEKRASMIEILGPFCRRRDVLYSTAILKKTGLRLAG